MVQLVSTREEEETTTTTAAAEIIIINLRKDEGRGEKGGERERKERKIALTVNWLLSMVNC